jgi:CRP-like cAMP-binding protein
LKPENETNYLALATLLSAESIAKMREQVIRILAQHMTRDISNIECTAIKDLFDVGAQYILEVKEILEGKPE